MEVVLTWLFTIYFFLSCAVLYLVNALICLCTARFDPRRQAVHRFSNHWAYHYFAINPFWKLEYDGVEQIKPEKTYVLVANHQSLADILVLYGLHKQFKWVSKREIAKVPFVGWNMKLNQYVFLERGDMKSIKEMMRQCREWLNKGASVMIFPEGTRSPDGRLHSFRDGAFKLALECNVELIPIVIDGTHEILGKGQKSLKFKQRIRTKVLPPVNPADFQSQPGAMRAHVFESMASTLAELRQVAINQVTVRGNSEPETMAKALNSSKQSQR